MTRDQRWVYLHTWSHTGLSYEGFGKRMWQDPTLHTLFRIPCSLLPACRGQAALDSWHARQESQEWSGRQGWSTWGGGTGWRRATAPASFSAVAVGQGLELKVKALRRGGRLCGPRKITFPGGQGRARGESRTDFVQSTGAWRPAPVFCQTIKYYPEWMHRSHRWGFRRWLIQWN